MDENNQNDHPKNNNKTPNPPQTYQEFVATDSNWEVIRQSPLYKTPLWGRLVHPLSEENVTIVDPDAFALLIWTTSKTDLLYDEGRLISKQLKMKGIRVTYLEARCSHILGFVMDKTFTLEFLEAWNWNVFTYYVTITNTNGYKQKWVQLRFRSFFETGYLDGCVFILTIRVCQERYIVQRRSYVMCRRMR